MAWDSISIDKLSVIEVFDEESYWLITPEKYQELPRQNSSFFKHMLYKPKHVDGYLVQADDRWLRIHADLRNSSPEDIKLLEEGVRQLEDEAWVVMQLPHQQREVFAFIGHAFTNQAATLDDKIDYARHNAYPYNFPQQE